MCAFSCTAIACNGNIFTPHARRRRRSLAFVISQFSRYKLRRAKLRAKGDKQLIPSINLLAHSFSLERVMRLSRCRSSVSPRNVRRFDALLSFAWPWKWRGETDNPGETLCFSLSRSFSWVAVADRGFHLHLQHQLNLFPFSCTACLTTASYCQRANIDRILYRMPCCTLTWQPIVALLRR